MFLQYMQPSETDKILDLGSGDGSHIAALVPFRKNVVIVDIDQKLLLQGKERYRFNTVLLDERVLCRLKRVILT